MSWLCKCGLRHEGDPYATERVYAYYDGLPSVIRRFRHEPELPAPPQLSHEEAGAIWPAPPPRSEAR
jgi:hypothetical protein